MASHERKEPEMQWLMQKYCKSCNARFVLDDETRELRCWCREGIAARELVPVGGYLTSLGGILRLYTDGAVSKEGKRDGS